MVPHSAEAASAAVRGDDVDALSTATADGSTRGCVSMVTFVPLPSLASATCTDDLERFSRMMGSADADDECWLLDCWCCVWCCVWCDADDDDEDDDAELDAEPDADADADAAAAAAAAGLGASPSAVTVVAGTVRVRVSGLSGGEPAQSCTVVASALLWGAASCLLCSPVVRRCCESCCSLKKSPESKYLCVPTRKISRLAPATNNKQQETSNKRGKK